MKPITAALAALAALSLPMLPLFAMGGSSGSSAPSASAPQYDPAAEYAKGLEALKTKDYAGAKKAFDRVIPYAAKDANTHMLAGIARAGLGDLKGATRFLQKAIKLNPGIIRAHQELGVVYARAGDRANAQKTLTVLKARDTTCATTCPDAAELSGAVSAVTQALGGAATSALDPGQSLLFIGTNQGDQLYLTAVSLINEGQYQAAIDHLQAAQARFGPHPDVLTYLGFANRKLGRLTVAETYYRQALTAAPQHKGATEYYGELMVERGNFAGAKVMLARLDRQCHFGCAEAEELRRWIAAGHSPHS
jgi:Flp pilus assembly protein TadD